MPKTILGITDGIGSLMYGPQKLGFKVLGNYEWRKYYNTGTFEKHFGAPYITDYQDTVSKWKGGIDLITSHPECFIWNTRIQTTKGLKCIRDVEPGDMVLTHEGRFKRVVRNISKQTNELIKLTIPRTNTVIVGTPNHPFMTDRGWINLGELLPTDKVRVLGDQCKNCGSIYPVRAWQKNSYCSNKCQVEAQWKNADMKWRKNQVKEAHYKTEGLLKTSHDRMRNGLIKTRPEVERSFEKILSINGLGFIPQYQIGRNFVDFFIPSKNLCVEISKQIDNGVSKHRIRKLKTRKKAFEMGFGYDEVDNRDAVKYAKRLVKNHTGDYHFCSVEFQTVPVNRNAKVYTLSVEDDNSYVANGCVVKNCGNYSNLYTGKNAETRQADPSDIFMFTDLAAYYQPKHFIADNLQKSLLAVTPAEWKKRFKDYNLDFVWVSNFGYGNTQRQRKRLFVVGTHRDIKWKFVPREFMHDRRLEHAIEDIRPGDPDHQKMQLDDITQWDWYQVGIWNKTGRMKLKDLQKFFAKMRWRSNMPYYNKAKELKSKPGYSIVDPANFSPVLSGGGGFYDNHWIFDESVDYFRPLTMRERLSIQGFGKDFVLSDPEFDYGTRMHQNLIKQTGKCMPVEFPTELARQILKGNTKLKEARIDPVPPVVQGANNILK